MGALTIAETANLTMSSREIANLTDKRHADVMRDIRNMLGQLELQADGYEQNCADPQNGQMYPVFKLPKDLTLTLVAGYNVKLRKRIIDRWLELEAKVGAGGTAIPQTLPEALRLAADLAEQKAKAEAQLAIAAPKALFHDAVSEAINCQSVQEIAKVLGTGPNRLFKFLRDEGLLMRDNLPYQQHLDAGYFRVVEKQYNDGRGESHTYTRTLVTGKGLAYIQKRLQNQNNILQESPA